jgi:hypothetical protein
MLMMQKSSSCVLKDCNIVSGNPLENLKIHITSRVSCTFFMEVERNTLVTSLAKFTFLNNLREMKQKNVESVKALIQIARTEANYLHDSWYQVRSSCVARFNLCRYCSAFLTWNNCNWLELASFLLLQRRIWDSAKQLRPSMNINSLG